MHASAPSLRSAAAICNDGAQHVRAQYVELLIGRRRSGEVTTLQHVEQDAGEITSVADP